MNRWSEWYLKRQIKLTACSARHWDVWVCGYCGRAVNSTTACICPGLPKPPTWEET